MPKEKSSIKEIVINVLILAAAGGVLAWRYNDCKQKEKEAAQRIADAREEADTHKQKREQRCLESVSEAERDDCMKCTCTACIDQFDACYDDKKCREMKLDDLLVDGGPPLDRSGTYPLRKPGGMHAGELRRRMHGEEGVASRLRSQLRKAIRAYEQRSGRQLELDAVDPFRLEVRRTYQAFSRASLRFSVPAGRGEWLDLEHGQKPLLRLVVEERRRSSLVAWCRTRGYLTLSLNESVREEPLTGTLCVTDSSSSRVVFVGRDRTQLEEAAALDEAMLASKPGDDSWCSQTLRLGELLGYPRCCVERFAGLGGSASNVEVVRDAAQHSNRFEGLLNNLSMSLIHTIGWFPCRYDCKASMDRARLVDRALGRQYGQQHARVRSMWRMPRLYLDERRQLIFDNAQVRDGSIDYETVYTPFSFDRSPSSALLDWLFYVDVVTRVMRGHRVSVQNRSLVIDKRGSTEVLRLGTTPILLPFG